MKTCFVICPLDKSGSLIRQRSDALLKRVIEPVLASLDYEVTRADLLHDEPTILASISKHIFDDDLVIADLSDCNPNVFYELGKRHAWGGATIHLTNDLNKLPFDISHHRTIEYKIEDAANLDKVRESLRLGINAIKAIPPQCPLPLTPERVIALTGTTVLLDTVDGRRDHYYLAEAIAKKPCSTIFLMQRSSTFILGPEQGWNAEEAFYNSIVQKINEGTRLYHMVSMEGILRHLSRPQSIFPNTQNALSKLYHSPRGGVGFKVGNEITLFKRIPDEPSDPDLKPDRQARTFLVQYKDGEVEGVLVVDLGGRQSCFHFRGPLVRNFLRSCLEFYDQAPTLLWSDLEKINGLQIASRKSSSKTHAN